LIFRKCGAGIPLPRGLLEILLVVSANALLAPVS
jgi:hypothetical protein